CSVYGSWRWSANLSSPKNTTPVLMLPQSLQTVFAAYPKSYFPRQWGTPDTAEGFSGASIYRLETDAGVFCLRGWPAGGLPKVRILGLHCLLKHVFAAGVAQVAVPVPALNGETLVTCNNQNWQLEPWMPGQADFWKSPSDQRLKNAMACLASFHRATRDYIDPSSARTWFNCHQQAVSPAIVERLGYLRDWQSEKLQHLDCRLPLVEYSELRELGSELAFLFRRIADLVGKQLELLSRLRFPLQPCLRDVWHDHLLFTGDQVTGLIDASACRYENIATDLSRLLGSLIADDRNAWELALREYETYRRLTDNERSLVQALDQSGVLLSGMAWLDRLILKNEQVAHFSKVMDRLVHLRDRLRTLDETIHGTLW
ncbi:MAG: phosphotransferase, partial [Planctomycetaceae bacterium]|nr:phosphotransferase [Planctomycetaceae bacterium]